MTGGHVNTGITSQYSYFSLAALFPSYPGRTVLISGEAGIERRPIAQDHNGVFLIFELLLSQTRDKLHTRLTSGPCSLPSSNSTLARSFWFCLQKNHDQKIHLHCYSLQLQNESFVGSNDH